MQAQLDGASVTLFLGTAATGMKNVAQATTTMGAQTNRLRVLHAGTMPFAFDNFRVLSRSATSLNATTYTYNSANQMTSLTSFGMTWNNSYDAWGRLISSTTNAPGGTFTRTYTYRFGDKLLKVTSNFPGETALVEYNYDGLGKRRLRVVGGDILYWRWDAGYSVVTQHQDTTVNWFFGPLTRTFVPFGHTALAEADMDSSGNPANAAYTYLAHDHLGTSRFGFNQSKTQVSAHEHLPFGQRHSATGPAPYHEFTGKPWDNDAKLFYFPYRYYSTAMNRWLGADPAGLVDGPNVYGYVGGSPNQRYDIYGDTWEHTFEPPGRWAHAFIGFSLERSECARLCCIKIQLVQWARSIGRNPAWNILNSDQTVW
ncbi:MAG: RHS repeat-associated core domain-containing protein, partial [Gammaproteobacteria bacterium]|nr:RHS repeat-associated core domain-containing protein [Gammaproteobacteria bacterium]